MKKRIISILLSLVLCLSLLPTMAFAYSGGEIPGTTGTGTASNPVICDNYQELKQALEYKGDLYIQVNSFSNLTGLDYYPLASGTDYTANNPAITVSGGSTKHLEINTNIKIKAMSVSDLLSSFITVFGNLYLSGSGKLSVEFNSTGFSNAVFYIASPGKLVVDDDITVDGSTYFGNFGRAIYNYSGFLEINGGTFSGITYDYISTAPDSSEAVYVDAYAQSVSISGGTFTSTTHDSSGAAYGLRVRGTPNVKLSGGTYNGIYCKSEYGSGYNSYNIKDILADNCKFERIGGGNYSSDEVVETLAKLKVVYSPEIENVTYGVVVSSAGNGTVSGGGTYKEGETATITATPDTGYVFDYWTDRYKNVVSGAGATYSFTVSRGRAYTAHFKKDTANTITITVVSSSGNGTVSGGGTYNKGETATITATPDEGYVFDYWTDGYGSKVSDAGAIYSFTVDDNMAFTAWFKKGAANTITAADVTIPAPVAGQKVTKYTGWTTDLPEKYTVSGGTWTKGTDINGAEMGENETFAAGQKYTAVFVVATKSGYTLADNFAATVNGNPAVKESSANLHLWYYTFTCPASGAITTADVTIPAPVAGQKVSKYTSWTTDAPEKYTVSGGTWTKGTDINGAEMGGNETFAAGQKYTAVLVVSAKSGYTLAENFVATVNGNPAVKQSSAIWYYTFTCPASGAPVITAQPKAVSIKAGESATFTVTATGENLKYQWYSVKDGKDTKITGATSATYTISKAEAAQNGLSYYCVVSNAKGNVTSAQALLSVAAAGAPVITAQPKAVTVKAGENATFTVTATGENLKYQWYAVDGGVPTKFATTATCTVKNVPLGYNGLNFYCVVTNNKGSVTSNQAKLTVLDPTYKFPFTDVKTTDWFYGDVLNANKLGLINGKSATEYKPNDNMTYAEAVKLAACMNQLYIDGAVTLTNAASGMWYDSYYQYCRDKGIISAKGDATNPSYDALYADANKNITREMYVYLFARCLPKSAFPEINKIADNAIPDVPVSMGVWDDGVYLFYRAGILQGSTVNGVEHMFLPDNNIKRSEVAAILSRMMDTNARLTFTM